MKNTWIPLIVTLMGCSGESVTSQTPTESIAVSSEAAAAPDQEGRLGLPFAPGVDPLTVCGPTDDLKHVEYFTEAVGGNANYAMDHERSTVQIQWRSSSEIRELLGPGSQAGNVGNVRWCSGTLIAENKILTAAHCFPSTSSGWILPTKNGNQTTPETNATLMKVVFNYQRARDTGATRRVQSYAIESLLEHWEGDLDFAVLQLGSVLAQADGYTLSPATVVTSKVPDDSELAIIQHPNGERKKIHTGELKHTSGPLLHYGNLDTKSASSGSAVRNAAGEIVGVHIRGGCGVASGTNKGVSTNAIAPHSDYL